MKIKPAAVPPPPPPANLWTVAKHVGRFGRAGGDIPATHQLKLFRPGEAPEDTGLTEYATVANFGTRNEAQDYIVKHALRGPQ